MSTMSRATRRYITMLVLVLALIAGWSWFWSYAAGKVQTAVEGWRAREAQAGRIYACGSEEYGGYPFRFELQCDQASALFRNSQQPVEVKARGILVAAQVYQPNLLIGEIHGPLTVAAQGQSPELIVNWKLFQTSVRGTPRKPERVSLVLDRPVVDRVDNGQPRMVLRADHAEIHGRMAEGSAADHPAIEIGLRLEGALAPGIAAAAAQPVDATVDTVLRGLSDFSPKPWHERFRQMQQAGGSIDVVQARLQQGETLAVGTGSISINPSGRMQGQLNMTIAGLEPFLKSIGAQQMVQNSKAVDKLAGVLDRLSPGLGSVAREQVGANISAGINLIGQQTKLEGRPAVILPLRFDDGAMFLGPIPLGQAPALF
ncbi:MAG: DUF2125 domain-containing protein [Rhodopseudomonas sp.]|nr:DUF2125 domain-containing protein [Rhodopseudomonas sp.]